MSTKARPNTGPCRVNLTFLGTPMLNKLDELKDFQSKGRYQLALTGVMPRLAWFVRLGGRVN